MTNDDGSTKAPPDPDAELRQQECPGDGSGRRFAHHWTWMSAGSTQMFSMSQCSRCGQAKKGPP